MNASLDGRYSLETPESVELDFTLAGPGSRFCAAFVDLMLVSFALLGLLVVFLLVIPQLSGLTDHLLDGDWKRVAGLSGWVLALLVLASFLLFEGYFVLFEILMGGQTPGKRHFRLRAIREDGTPMTLTDALVRNLLRPVDFLPFFYVLGGLVSFLNSTHKRLGDLAAGTIVICESEFDYRGRTDKKYEVRTPTEVSGNAELSPKERQIINGFLNRREELFPSAREVLAEKLASSLHRKYGGIPGDAESYLERLLRGTHYEP